MKRHWQSFKMVAKISSRISKFKSTTLSFIFLFLTLILITLTLQPKPQVELKHTLQKIECPNRPKWYNIVFQRIKSEKIKIGLVNIDDVGMLSQSHDQLCRLPNSMTVKFDHVDKNRRWEEFFPEWIDEDKKWGTPTCPEIPMPEFTKYGEVDVVVARVPCGVRDVYRLQVNLVVAHILVRSGWDDDVANRTAVYVVFIGDCGPMWEVFRCDDMLWSDGYYWVYKPDLILLKEKVLMPVGSCQLATSYIHSGDGVKRNHAHTILTTGHGKQKEAYVTVLHSSEAYICGAIALAQSLVLTNTTKDLILLADNSISSNSLLGLRNSGWIVKQIERIQSPHAKKDAYNEWNYSKLRIWELTDYTKIIFIDSDLIILQNIDKFFDYPQLSAVGNDRFLFNSGIMLVEPSKCTFKSLMEKKYEVESYNGGDQGFLNEMFPWWHRWPKRLNRLKVFDGKDPAKHDDIPDTLYAIHYLGLKPWVCYMDYDCNWDKLDHQRFASDEAHKRWWRIYKVMSKQLQSYCGLSESMDLRIKKWRGIAKAGNLSDRHWKIEVKDPRRHP